VTTQDWARLEDRIGYPLVYAKLWGSRSHNTHLPDSDWDYIAVYRVPTDVVLGLNPWPDTRDGKMPDYEAHEVKKFCELLLKGNPGILEMLFADREQFVGHPSWKILIKRRMDFISQRAVSQYLGYARGQVTRLANEQPLHTTGGAYNTKWAYHIVRLCQDAERLSRGAPPIVWREGEEHEYLMAIREGKVVRDAIVARLADTLARIGDADKLPLPKEGPREFLNEWLLGIRERRGAP